MSYKNNIFKLGLLTGIGKVPTEELDIEGNVKANGRLILNDGGNSVYIGIDSGLNDDETDNRNTGVGYNALISNTTGQRNSVSGYAGLSLNTTGNNNTVNGYLALRSNTSGSGNTANGYEALFSNLIGSFNTGHGYRAGRFTNAGLANETSSNGVYLGNDTRALASGGINEIVIGSTAQGNGSNTVTLGNDSITDTYLKGNVIGDVATAAQGVLADNSVQLTGETSQAIDGNITVKGGLYANHIGQVTNALAVTSNSNDVFLSLYRRAVQGSPDILIRTSGNSYFNGGNLGIGITTPLAPIHISNAAGGKIYLQDSDASLGQLHEVTSSTNNFQLGTRTSAGSFVDTFYQAIGSASGTNIQQWNILGVNKMTLNNSGVFVNGGDIRITDTFPALILDGTTGGNVWSFLEVASGNLEIRVNDLQKLFIDASGNTQINGNVKANSFLAPLITIVENTNLTISNSEVIIDAASQAVSATLPAVASVPVNKKYTVIAYDATNTITLGTSNSEQIRLVKTDVSTSVNLTSGNVYTIVNTGTYWQIINKI